MTQASIDYDDSSGIYCFFPFERLDKDGIGAFKIGNTSQTFQERLSSYHTYFIHGVYVIGFIKVYEKRGKERPIHFKSILNIIESWVLDRIGLDGGEVLYDKRRTWKRGQSEWVISSIGNIQNVFKKAVLHFKKEYPDLGFLLDNADEAKTLTAIKANHKERSKLKNKFVAEYIFPSTPNTLSK